MPAQPPPHVSASAWAPMASTAFRVLWFAQLGSNIGGWMQTVGAQWFLVEASASPVVIALVQTASLAPAVLLSLVAGVLADSYDRRRLLIVGSVASAVLAAALAAVSATGTLTAVLLLGFTFLLGVSATLTSPAWQAIQPELVPREQIGASAALGGLTVNGARAIGPALAGVVLSAFGAPVVFGINALSFLGAVAALLWWKRPPQAGLEDREHFGPALAAGLRYVASAHLVRRILLRSALFALPASALWALLPLTATRLHLGSSGYGLLLTGPGVGAVLGIVLLPAARRRFSDNWTIAVSALLYAAGAAAAAFLPLLPTLLLLVLAGIAWIGTLTVLNTALQLTLPQWVRSRGAAMYILVFMGTMALGSVGWGALASAIGTPLALTASAVVLALVGVSVLRLPLLPGTGVIDRSARLAWDSPTLLFEPAPSDGPVLITVSYTVRAASRQEFQQAMTALGASRRRTGAFRWRLYRSGEEEDVWFETFLLPSWSEYQRQQTQRSTGRDREIEARALAACEGAPVRHHYFAGETDDAGRTAATTTGAPAGATAGPTVVDPHRTTTEEHPHA